MNNSPSIICSPQRHLAKTYLKSCTAIALGFAIALPFSIAQAAVAPLTVSGNKILVGGQQGSLAGNSLFWSNTGWGGEKFFSSQTVAWLKSDWKSTLVRAPMGADESGGYLTDSSNKTRITTVVDAAIANDMYAIIDWHSHHAEQYQAQSITFFKEMATKYGSSNNVIYEIYNEPLQVSWSSVIKPYAQAVIAAIRSIDPDNLIVVGTPSWSQDVDVAANDPITGYANIAYTLHFYAGTHGQSLRDKAQIALNKGVALFVTEWGSVNADGGGSPANSETTAWMDFLKTNKISHANWALNDKAEGASALVSGASGNGGWVSSQLTASGALDKSIILGWPAISGGTSSSVASSAAVSSAAVSSAAASIAPSSIAASSTPKSSVAPSSSSRSSVASSSKSSVAASSTPRSSVAASSSSVATGSGANCKQIIGSEWGNGFNGTIRITNTRTTAINGWSISWRYSDSTSIANIYNATVTGSNPYSASNLSWNGTIQPGQYVEFGFQATKGGTAVNVPVFTGTACN